LLEITPELAAEVAHEAGEWCRHCTQPGCGIYASRPKLCREFSCEWLKNPKLGDHWFPATSGMILTFDDDEKTLHIVVDPDRPDAHLAEPYASDIARMRRHSKRGPVPFEVVISSP
jgi:Fe-S-cluster containining protein